VTVVGVQGIKRRRRGRLRLSRARGYAYDAWSHDEWWRAQNPGSSLFRGLLWALALSAPLWAGLLAALWIALS